MVKSKPSAIKGGIAATPAKPGGVTRGAPMMKKGGHLKDLDDTIPKSPSKNAAADKTQLTTTGNGMGAIKQKVTAADATRKYAKGGSAEGFKRGPKMQTTMR